MHTTPLADCTDFSLETVTEAPLVQALVRLLVAAETNVRDMNLLEIILDKMNSTDNVGVLPLTKTQF